MSRAVSVAQGCQPPLQLHEDLEAVPIEEWCGKLCGPTFVLGPGQVFPRLGEHWYAATKLWLPKTAGYVGWMCSVQRYRTMRIHCDCALP